MSNKHNQQPPTLKGKSKRHILSLFFFPFGLAWYEKEKRYLSSHSKEKGLDEITQLKSTVRVKSNFWVR